MSAVDDLLEKLATAESERDAAIAAKEAAEQRWTDTAERAGRYFAVVEAARNLYETAAGRARSSWPEAKDMLFAALRALDAGEAPKSDTSPAWVDWKQTAANAQDEAERLRVQLAGCSVAAMGGDETPSRATRGMYGWSVAYDDVAKLYREKEDLRSALARAEELRDNAEASCARLRAELATIKDTLASYVERTAKAQRISDAGLAEKGRDPVSWPLVTLSTLPEADSSGGGEKKCDHDGVPEELCRHCGAQRAAHWNGKYCPKKDSLWGAALTVFDPAPPKSERDEEGHFPGCKTFGCEATACRAEPFLSMAMQRKDNTPPKSAEHPGANIMDATDGPRCACGSPSRTESGSCGDIECAYHRGLVRAAEPEAEAIDEWTDAYCDRELALGIDETNAVAAIKRRNARIASDAEVIAGLREDVRSLRRKVRGAQHCTDEQDEVIAGLRQALESIRSMAADREAFVRRGPMAFVAAVRICEEALKKGPAE